MNCLRLTLLSQTFYFHSWMLDENSEIDHYLATVLDENRYLPFHCRYFSLERAPL